MTPLELVNALSEGRIANVDHRDVHAIHDVCTGYAFANGAFFNVHRALDDIIPGYGNRNLFSKAYLHYDDPTPVVLARLRDALEGEFAGIEPVATPAVADGFMPFVAPIIEKRRWGMVFAEDTFECISNTWIGFNLGVEALDPPLAATYRAEAEEFDRFVRRDYGIPNVSWKRILRGHYMVRLPDNSWARGPEAFLATWRKFEAWRARMNPTLLLRFEEHDLRIARTLGDNPRERFAFGVRYAEVLVEKDGFLGFYDWLRTPSGKVMGLRLRILDERIGLARLIPNAPYVIRDSEDVLRILFRAEPHNEKAPWYQDFGHARVYRDDAGRVLLSVDAMELTAEELAAFDPA